MASLYSLMTNGIHTGIILTIHMLEAMGFIVILVSALRAFMTYWKKKDEEAFRSCRLNLAEGLATGLEFKLGGEILRTLVVRDMEEITVLGAIVAHRVAMAQKIYRDKKQENTIHPNGAPDKE